MREKREQIFKLLSIVLLSFFVVIFLILSTMKKQFPTGEYDDYMMATISFQNHHTFEITPKDMERASVDFKNFFEVKDGLKYQYDHGGHIVLGDGRQYALYFGTYSVACIPVKLFLELSGLNQIYAYPISNVLFYALALLSVFFFLKKDYQTKFYLLLFLIFSPTIINYYWWPSAEVFIASLVIVSLVFFYNKNYKISAFFLSLAGTLNLTIMAIGIFMIIAYFCNLIKNSENSKMQTIKNNLLNIIKYGFCFFPCLIPPLMNLKNFGHFSPIVTAFFNNPSKYLLSRFFSYIFDLNLGIFPYYPLLFLAFLICLIFSMIKKQREGLIYGGAFFATILGFSFMPHINCGMTGIARYNVWIVPVMIFFVIFVCSNVTFINKLSNVLLLFSLICTFYVTIKSKDYDSLSFSPVARFVMDKIPSIYNPFYIIFAYRADHEDKGYHYGDIKLLDRPIFYYDKSSNIRKILVTPKNLNQLTELIEENSTATKISDLVNIIEKNKNKKSEYFYINIPKKFKFKKKLSIATSSNDAFYPSNEKFDFDFTFGLYSVENHLFSWMKKMAQLALNNKMIGENGLLVKISVPILYDNNLSFSININGVDVSNEKIAEAKEYDIYIPPEKISNPDKFDNYVITLNASNSFIPKYFLNNSNDLRELSVQILYVGPRQ